MKTTFTQSTKFFESISAPKIGIKNEFITDSQKFPTKLEFNRTYYMYEDNKLIAFRVLAYAYTCVNSTLDIVELSYLVQLPNQQPCWKNLFLTTKSKVFNSPDDFIKHQSTGNCEIDLNWEIGRATFRDIAYAAVIGTRGNVWSWSNTYNCPVNNFFARFDYFVVCEQGLFIGIPKSYGGDKYYLSAEECIKDRLNGLEIIDFAEEPVKITINVLPNAPKIHTLRFIEE